MKVKIDKSIPLRIGIEHTPNGESLKGFVHLLRDMQAGNSVLIEKFKQTHRQAISIIQYCLDRKYVSRAENGSVRIWRVS